MFDSAEALPAIYNHSRDDDELDLQQEQAILVRKQAEKLQLQIDEQKGKLVKTEDVLEESSKCVMRIRSKLLALPTKMANAVHLAEDQAEIQHLLKEQIYDALTELAEGSLA